jgi:hypothetical protein
MRIAGRPIHDNSQGERIRIGWNVICYCLFFMSISLRDRAGTIQDSESMQEVGEAGLEVVKNTLTLGSNSA